MTHGSQERSKRNRIRFVEYFRFLKQFEDENTVAKYTIPAPAQMFQQMIIPAELCHFDEKVLSRTNDALINDIGIGISGSHQTVLRRRLPKSAA